MRSIETRLRRAEAGRVFTDDIAQASDAQLYNLIRSGYRGLIAEYGSLAQAVEALRRTGDAADAALATIIEEDTGGPDARHH